MPENRNTGRNSNKNVDIDAYLDSLSQKPPKREIKVSDEEVFVKKPSTPPFSQQRTSGQRPTAQRPVSVGQKPVSQRLANSQLANSQRVSSQSNTSRNSATNTPQRRPAPPRYKENGKFVDVEERKKQSNNPVLKWFYNLSKGNQRLVKVFSIFLIFTIFISSALGIFIDSKFDKMGSVEEDYNDIVYEENLENLDDIDGNINASNFKEALKLWATTGNDQKMTSKNVVNVLLIGADSRKGINTGNTDTMLLVSLNKKTKQIKLVSFMRDSYLYIEGKNNSTCSKLNAAFSMGGPETLMATIENNFKIEIDNFVMVNFESFKAIIEAMDGITVDVKKYEANYANNRYKLSMPYGDDVTLNGEEALAFCRIRGCDADGDISRTRRERSVINAIINRVTSASVSDLNKYLNVLLPYVYTGFSRSEILSLGMKALTNGWAFYDRSELQIPTNETCQSGSMGSWIWVVDYQQTAHILQNELYGTSNITLEDGRTTLIDIYNGTTGSGGSSSSSSTSKPLEKEEVSTTESTTLPDDILEEEFIEEDMEVPETEEPEEVEESTTEIIEESTTEEPEEDDIEDTTLVTIGDDQ